MSFFELQHTDKNCAARAGIMHTDHGDIATPVFMPVGTQASVKTLDSSDLTNLGAQIILGNTYHLHLRPGEDLIDNAGGLHKFMNWDKPILTDSGGFQVFSLGLQKKTQGKHISPLPRGSEEGVAVDCDANNEVRNDGKPPTPASQARALRAGLNPSLERRGDNARLVSIDEDGVTFRSHIDGSEHRFTAESAIDIQHKLGADIIMAFDECTPDNADEKYVHEAMERTHRWAERSLVEHKRLSGNLPLTKGEREGVAEALTVNRNRRQTTPARLASESVAGRPTPPWKGGDNNKPYRQFIFGIIQGANYEKLRKKSAKYISSLDFDGIAIGGESIGYNMSATKKILDWVYPIIPENKPHYAMGVGLSPADLLVTIEHGADMFDCVGPTRLARHGMLFVKDTSPATPPTSSWKEEDVSSPSAREEELATRGGSGSRHRINITNAKFEKDFSPIDKNCSCSTCQNYTRAYIHHLFNAQEMSAMRLASIHNLHFMIDLMAQAREAILEDRFAELLKKWTP